MEATVAEVQATGPQGLEPKEVQGYGSGCFLADKPRTGKAKDRAERGRGFGAQMVSCDRQIWQDTFGIQSLTTNRGGQSSRRPSRWACNKASVQSWKKWLRSLNPKSRTIRSNVSRCSRRTLVVRLPCVFWVNPASVFILEISVAQL